jgi:hypothetical protein
MATAGPQVALWRSSRMNSFERIAFVGLVYIGLPTAAVFADDGIEVRVCTFISLCEYDE